MSNEQFFSLFSRTNRRNILTGIFLLVFGISAIAGALLAGGAQFKIAGKIIMLLFGGICILLGILMPLKAIRAGKALKTGKHPLAKAILTHDKGFLLWFHEQVYTVENVQETATHQIWMYNRYNTFETLSIKRHQSREVMEYLSQKFPDAMVGYSEEYKKVYRQMVTK